jgi:hypothetical protein
MCKERTKNAHINIPTPNICCAFEDHGRYYLITDFVLGVTLAQLPDEKKAPVIKELEGYIAQLLTIKLQVMGGFCGDVILPYRVGLAIPQDQIIKLREATTPEFVLYHNNPSQCHRR